MPDSFSIAVSHLETAVAALSKGARPASTQRTPRLGQSAKLTNPAPGGVPTAVVNGCIGRWEPIGKKTRLITADTTDERSTSPGSWVLTFSSAVVENLAVDPEQVDLGCPLVAEITFGSGGIVQTVLVDAWNATIAIPAQTVTVDVYYTQLYPNDAGIDYTTLPGSPRNYPNSVVCSVTAHRTLETGAAVPTLSRMWAPSAGGNTYVPIPRFATAWTYIPTQKVMSGDLPITTAKVISVKANIDTSGITKDDVLPEVVASMSRMFCFRDLPPNCNYIELIGPLGFGTVIFQLGL